MLFEVILEYCETVTHIQCRSVTAAVEERCRACLNGQGNHFEHLISMLMFTFNK